MSAWADLDLSAIVEAVARVAWEQSTDGVAWADAGPMARHRVRELALPLVVATRDALAGDVEAMLDRARAEALREAAEAVLAPSDDLRDASTCRVIAAELRARAEAEEAGR